MANKFKKGDEVYLIQSWDNKGTFTYRKMIVKSCGQKRMTLEIMSEGKMLEEAIYAQRYFQVYLASEVDDVEALTLKIAAEFIQNELESNKRKLEIPADNKKFVLENIEWFENAKPIAVEFEVARAAIRTKV